MRLFNILDRIDTTNPPVDNGGPTNGPDVIFGLARADTLRGLGGNDRIYGKGGNDRMFGGSGNDKMFGGSGRDTIYGDLGDDLIRGGTGNDRLFGKKGNDRIYGDSGNDYIEGGQGRDKCFGGSGRDLFDGGGYKSGADLFSGGSGIDTVTYAKYTPRAGVTITIDGTTNRGGNDASGDRYVSIENFVLTSIADQVVITSIANGGYVYAGAGDDTIRAHGFTMRGDDGLDTLICDPTMVTAETVILQNGRGKDTVQNFDQGTDKFQISSAAFGISTLTDNLNLFNRAADNNPQTSNTPQFIYDQTTGLLVFDANGTDAGGDVEIATLDIGLTLTSTDFLIV